MLAATLTCLVIAISDGRTLTARCGEARQYEEIRVRLQGIDTPERNQHLANRTREALSQLAYMKPAKLRCNSNQHENHRICSVWIKPNEAPGPQKTLDIGLALLTQGMAKWNQADSDAQSPQERGQYAFAQTEAKARKAGLWREHCQ